MGEGQLYARCNARVADEAEVDARSASRQTRGEWGIAHASATARGRSAMAIVTIAEIIEHTTSTRRLPHRSHARKAAEINENYKRSSNTRTYTQALHGRSET